MRGTLDGDNPRATGERDSAESAANRRPSNLIWIMPAKGVGLTRATACLLQVRRSSFTGPMWRSSRVKAVVVAGGDADPGDRRELGDADLLIAADDGATWLDRIGRRPAILVGDLDSVDGDLVDRLAGAGTTIERHPADKDASDLELTIERAVREGADRIVVIGALAGDRLDHELANLLCLADPRWLTDVADLRIVRNGTRVRALHGGRTLELEAPQGGLVTLLPVGGDAIGVGTTGLRFPLHGDALPFGRSRGLSNVVESAPASVSLERGVLLVIEIATEGVNG